MTIGHCRKHVWTLIMAALLASLFATSVFAQSSNGSVRGTVMDQSRAVIAKAAVRLVNTATNVELRTETNDVGLYVFPAVVPGPYRLIAEHPGMRNFEGTLTVQVQQPANVDAILQPATATTTVEVVDVTPVLVTDSPSLSHTLERARIEQLPINGRNVVTLLNTVPGLTWDDEYAAGGTPAIRTHGTRMGTHDFSLDGAALTDAVSGMSTLTRPPSLDSIQEFRVEVNSVSAKFARQTNIIMTTKSGTNQLHGSLFETHRSNRIGFARTRENMTNTAAHYVRNEYGGTVGGPVFIPRVYNGKNRTFFFVSYEGFKKREGSIGGFRVPTQAMRDGDFRGLVTGTGTQIKVYNPFETSGTTFSRPQFAYKGVPNVIDPALQSPLSKYMNSILPLPTLPDVNPLVADNYFAPKPDIQDQWTWTTRIDHQFGSRDQVYARYSDNYSNRWRASSGVPTLDKVANTRTDYAPNKSLAGAWTHTFSPTLVNELMFSGTRQITASSTGEADVLYASQLGLPNPNAQVGYPIINNIGVGAGSGNYFSPVAAKAQYFAYFILDNNATKIRGRHELQFGAHLRYDQLTYLPQQQGSGGQISFPALATGLYDPTVLDRSRAAANTGHIAASSYLGLANYTYRVVKGKFYMRQHEDAFYFQDNFRATSRLTLNLGVRWQFSPIAKDKYNLMTSFDKKNMAVVLGNDLDTMYKLGATTPSLVNILQSAGVKFESPEQAGLPRALVKDNWFDIGPHLGFAYRALEGRKSFVLRGGFSTTYFPVPMYGWNDRMRLNSPFTAMYQNQALTSSAQSPDGIQNYGLVSVPTIIAGKNSSTAVNLTNPLGVQIGADAFQTAYFRPDQPTSRVHDWNLTMEKEIFRNMVVRAAYVGNHQAYQDSYDSWNACIPDNVWFTTRGVRYPQGTLASAQCRPNSTLPYGELQEFAKDGWGNSNGAQVELQRRYSNGWGFQVFYNVTNSLRAAGHGWYGPNDSPYAGQGNSQVLPVSSFLPGEVPEDHHERMKSLLYMRDITVPKHEIRGNWVVDLPFGSGKHVGRNAKGVLNQLIGGWQLTGMARWRSNYFLLPTSIWANGNPVEYYGHKYPIQDCRSGKCQPGYLMWNGYIPAFQINKPGGILGVPENYKPAGEPLWPYPADYPSRNAKNDPNYAYYGTNIRRIPLKDGTVAEAWSEPRNPWANQALPSTNLWNCDATIFKSFPIRERVSFRLQADFFNVFNTPGNRVMPGNDGIVSTQYSVNTPRQLQFTGRLNW